MWEEYDLTERSKRKSGRAESVFSDNNGNGGNNSKIKPLFAEIFRKAEPYLTFLNVHQLERQGADVQTKIEELEEQLRILESVVKVSQLC